MKYKVGDKVVIRERKHGHQFSIGETVKIEKKTYYDYYAKNESGKGWWIMDDEIEYPSYKSYSKDEIHITTEGRYTHAVKKFNGKVVARAEAKCHEDDVFDFNVGVNLCLERLGVKEEVKIPAPTTEHFAVGDIVIDELYPDLGKCIIVKVEDDGMFWITPINTDTKMDKEMAKNYMTKSFIEHETAFAVDTWHKVTKVTI